MVRYCELIYNLFGLWIEGVKDVYVVGNVIVGKCDYFFVQCGNGIQFYNMMGVQFDGNEISFLCDGIYVDVLYYVLFCVNCIYNVCYGMYYMNFNDNVWEGNEFYYNCGGLVFMMMCCQIVCGNCVWGNIDYGIMLCIIQDLVIEDNVVFGNLCGFFVYDVEYNVLSNNFVIGNMVGMYVWVGFIYNKVDGNDFIDNQEQVCYVVMYDELWGGCSGNYWSNYVGWDCNGDGCGDVFYCVSDLMDWLLWCFLSVKLLFNSFVVQMLRLILE